MVTQPRKLAASELAARVAFEWGPRAPIGELRVGAPTQKIAYCTDSRLLNVIRTNPTLEGIDCVIVDEVHERSISTDLLLGCLKGVLRQRPSLRLVLTSATMDRVVFQDFFRDVCRRIGHDASSPQQAVAEVPVIDVPGRTFPVDDHYEDAEEDHVTFA